MHALCIETSGLQNLQKILIARLLVATTSEVEERDSVL